MSTQAQRTKLAEVKFRAQIVSQHLGKSQVFANEPNAKEIMRLLHKRNKEAEEAFLILKKRDLALSPYLEIGSEYCQQAATLENKFKAIGFATDISPSSLAATPHFCRQFKFIKVPQRICADAYNLPFKSGSFPFVFIYETLHHFPDPKPVFKEIERVTAPGGICLIGGDPIKQKLQIKLWRRPTKLRPLEKFLKILLVLPFISHIGKTEIEHGIIETAFPLKTWQRALSIYDDVQVTLQVFPFGWTETVKKTNKVNWIEPSFKTRFFLNLLGGGLQAICQKAPNANSLKSKTKSKKFSAADLNSLLICPDCLVNNKEENTIEERNRSMTCPSCGTKYKKYKGVLILLEKKLKAKILSA